VDIELDEAVVPDSDARLKTSNVTEPVCLGTRTLDLAHLHNTHSWVVVSTDADR
jgi:hypothetical protein